MLVKILVAWGLLALSVAVHAGGLSAALSWLRRRPLERQTYWHSTALFVRIAGWMVLLHVLEVVAWAVVYHWATRFRGYRRRSTSVR